MSTAIRIENVSKLYRLGTVGTGTISHDLNRWWHLVRGKEDPYAKVGQVNDRTKKSGELAVDSSQSSNTENCKLKTENSQRPNKLGSAEYVWALRDINLEVQQGEILGIIGRNGAGKSTLLKLLSRVTAPTTGEIKTKGRIASLLEVGTGFHPELTGRENIYMNGSILGMRRHEITRLLDEIVEFSGCAKYLDTPVKRYSSGMTVRLGFAVAAHLACEVLIVDEVLAVGDAEFQRRCLGRMKDVAKTGKTVIFVSHNILSIKSLCTNGVYLNAGSIVAKGGINEVAGYYLRSGCKANHSVQFDNNDQSVRSENIRIIKASVLDVNKQPAVCVRAGQNFYVEIVYEVTSLDTQVKLNLHFVTADSEYAFATFDNTKQAGRSKGLQASTLEIPANFLNNKSYALSIYATSVSPTRVHAAAVDCLTFDVEDSLDVATRCGYDGVFPGAVRPLMNWHHRQIS